jgi:hypothetical protein
VGCPPPEGVDVAYPLGLGKYVPQVSDEIEMRFISQAVEAKAYATYLKAQEAAEAAGR